MNHFPDFLSVLTTIEGGKVGKAFQAFWKKKIPQSNTLSVVFDPFFIRKGRIEYAPACRFHQPADTRAVVMVLCGSAVPFSSVGDLLGLSLPSHVQVVFHNRCCHGKAVAGTDEPNSWSGGQKLRSDAQNGQLSEGLQFSLVFWTQLFASRHRCNS